MHDNHKDKDMVLKIVLKNSTLFLQSTPQLERYRCNHFQNDFFQLMNDKNIDSQSESILL